jgi:hypothetical protein
MRFAQVAELLYTFDGCHGDLYRFDAPLSLSLIEWTSSCANEDALSYHADMHGKSYMLPYVHMWSYITC